MVARKDPAARIRRNVTPEGPPPRGVLRPDVETKPPAKPAGVAAKLWARCWSDPASQMWTTADEAAVARWCFLEQLFLVASDAGEPRDAVTISTEMRQIELQLGMGAAGRAKQGWVIEAAPEPVAPAAVGDVVDSAARFAQRAKR